MVGAAVGHICPVCCLRGMGQGWLARRALDIWSDRTWEDMRGQGFCSLLRWCQHIVSCNRAVPVAGGPAGRYLEIFARKNNLRNYWVSVGNEVTGTGLPEEDMDALRQSGQLPNAVFGRGITRPL